MDDHLSWSRIQTWLQCGERYRLRYVEGVPASPHGALIGGSAVHATIARSEELRWWEHEEPWTDGGEATAHYLAELARRIEEAGEVRWGGRKTREFPNGEDRTWWERTGPMMLRRYAALRRDMDADGWGLVDGGAEMQVTVPLGDGVPPLLGYVDAFLAHRSGEPIVLDWKTGQVGGGDVMQLAIYAWLIGRGRGIEVDVGTFVYLRTPARDRQVQRVDVRTIVPHVEEAVLAAHRGIQVGAFVARPGPFCRTCPVREACWYGRTLEVEP